MTTILLRKRFPKHETAATSATTVLNDSSTTVEDVGVNVDTGAGSRAGIVNPSLTLSNGTSTTLTELKQVESNLTAAAGNMSSLIQRRPPLKREPKAAYSGFLLMEKMHSEAYQFHKSTPEAAGYDIKAFEQGTVPARGSTLVKTNMKVGLPVGHYGRIASRSGLAVKHNIEVGAGVIDQDYHGEVLVLLRNHSDVPYNFNAGDKIAQMIIEPYRTPPIKVVNNIEQILGTTVRGAGGFGSTGY